MWGASPALAKTVIPPEDPQVGMSRPDQRLAPAAHSASVPMLDSPPKDWGLQVHSKSLGFDKSKSFQVHASLGLPVKATLPRKREAQTLDFWSGHPLRHLPPQAVHVAVHQQQDSHFEPKYKSLTISIVFMIWAQLFFILGSLDVVRIPSQSLGSTRIG